MDGSWCPAATGYDLQVAHLFVCKAREENQSVQQSLSESVPSLNPEQRAETSLGPSKALVGRVVGVMGEVQDARGSEEEAE